MNIALLNLPVDDNYGGNLQRYALFKVLQNMGHDVTHILVMRKWTVVSPKILLSVVKRLVLKLFFHKDVVLFAERKAQKENCANFNRIAPFYNRYIKHTEPIYNYESLKKIGLYDAYVVGSDQVWRKKIVEPFPLKMFFGDFIHHSAKRIAYAVSLGNDEPELEKKEADFLEKFYNKFYKVSVREKSALNLLNQYGWNNPKADWLLDPTLLLKKEDYIELINASQTSLPTEKLFCYILDLTKEKQNVIETVSKEKGLRPFITGLHEISIEQWLRNIAEAEFIVTDSYHGFVFSIIFNKPVRLLFNKYRGNARFESILKMLDMFDFQQNFNWAKINQIICVEREKSLNWLKNALETSD